MLSRLQKEAADWALTAHVVVYRSEFVRSSTGRDESVGTLVYGGRGAVVRHDTTNEHLLLLPVDSPALYSGDKVTVDGENYSVPADMPPTATRAALRKIPIVRRGGAPSATR